MCNCYPHESRIWTHIATSCRAAISTITWLPNSELCPSLTRDEFKERFLADVIAKRKANKDGAEYPSAVEDCFRKLFPSVYRFIRDINCDGWEHANLIRLLQRQESTLVIETVAADLLTRLPRLFVLTLHDAIFTAPQGIPAVVSVFHAAFCKIDFPMTLKIAT